MVGAVTATCLGIALIAVVAHDVFDALFHHRGAGILSGAVMRTTWRGFRRASVRRRSLLPLAGPFALVAVVAMWLVLLVTGWALVLWPHIIDGFRFDPGAASGEATLVDAVYVSLVTLATLGFGDITPASGWLKLVLPLEALIGLGLLTATVSWLLSIHPALSRRRSLAYEISLLRRAEADLEIFALERCRRRERAVRADLAARGRRARPHRVADRLLLRRSRRALLAAGRHALPARAGGSRSCARAGPGRSAARRDAL